MGCTWVGVGVVSLVSFSRSASHPINLGLATPTFSYALEGKLGDKL